MLSVSIVPYLLLVIVIWLALLNFYLLRSIRTYKRLTRGAKGQNLDKVLQNFIEKLDLDERKIDQISKDISKIDNLNKLNFQKMALIRFNPFEDTGGDQSFALAILDGENNGIVISSLHSRTSTRIYAKQISNGLALSHQFSKEEKEVVEKAARPA